MGQDPSTIRKDIEQTRERMGDTVEALAYKTDVGARTKDAIGGRVDSVKEKLGVAGDKISTAGDAMPDGSDVKAQARQAKGLAQENPLGLAIGAVAIGFVAGLLIPNTKAENQAIGPVAGELRGHVEEAAQLAVDHGKDAVKDVAGTLQEKASDVAGDVASDVQDVAQQHAEDAKGDLADKAQDAQQTAAHPAG